MSTRQDSKRCQELPKPTKKSDAVQCQVQDKSYLDWTLISQNLCGIQVYHHRFTDRITVIKSTVLREQTEFGILPFFDWKKKKPPNYWTVLMRKKVKIKRFRYSEQNSLYKLSTAKNKQVWRVKLRWIKKVQKTTSCLRKSDIFLYSIFEEETFKLRWQAETLIWIKKKK